VKPTPRVVTKGMAFVLVIAAVAGLSACADFDVACAPVPPTVLPDGSSPGSPVTDSSLGPEMLMWGSGSSAVREAVTRVAGGDGFDPTPGLFVDVNYPAQFRDATDSPSGRPGIRWQQAVCRYEIWLDPSKSDSEVIDYAARF
jgi:hypothetical protein